MVSFNPLHYAVDQYDDEDYIRPVVSPPFNHSFILPPPITGVDLRELVLHNRVVFFTLAGIVGCVVIGGAAKLALVCYRKRHGTSGTLPAHVIPPAGNESNNSSQEVVFDMEEELRNRKGAQNNKDK